MHVGVAWALVSGMVVMCLPRGGLDALVPLCERESEREREKGGERNREEIGAGKRW